MMRPLSILALVAALSLPGGRLVAQDSTAMKRNVPDSLVSQAKISEDSARAVALKRVPGSVQNVALARQRGRLLYEFWIQRDGRKGTTEVKVNAMTGRIAAVNAGTRAKARSTTRHSS
jgi:uncharacterized membrane protein YkoI